MREISLKTVLFTLFVVATLGGGRRVEATSTPSFKTSFIGEIKKYLPPQLKETLKETKIVFKDLGDLPLGCKPRGENRRVFGRLKNNKTIELNEGLIHWYRQNQKMDCLHGSSKNVAIATVIHELVHAWEEDLQERTVPSRRRHYVDLVHAKKNILGSIKILNQKTQRLPDSYELKNIREHFAVNMEYFLLDETYQCRRPNLYQYFGKTFNFYPVSDCSFNYKIRLHDKSSAEGFRSYHLDPHKVRAIHYVQSGQGKKAMSRFGHAGFRLLICDEDLSDAQCLQDTSQHLYVNFVARVEEGIINNVQGLTGKYPIQLEIINFKDSLKSYTEVQEREVYSYPLKMSFEEKERFIHQVLTLFWEYAGRYFFTAKNCATEAFRLLKATYGESYPKIRTSFKTTPNSVKRKLKKLGLLDDTPISQKVRGYFFHSSALILERLFSKVAHFFPTKTTRQDFFSWPLESRQRVYANYLSRRERLIFSALEKHILKRQLSFLEAKMGSLLFSFKENRDPEKVTIFQKAQRLYELENLLKYGADSGSGYGILLEQDGAPEVYAQKEQWQRELSLIEGELEVWSRESLANQWQQVEQGLALMKKLML